MNKVIFDLKLPGHTTRSIIIKRKQNSNSEQLNVQLELELPSINTTK